jgi:hypothetical protein
MKAASKTMVDRLVKKAELIDSGVLSAMMEDGKLKTLNPADRSQTFQTQGHYSPSMLSPNPQSGFPQSAYPQSPGMMAHRESSYGRQSMYGAPSPGLPPAQGLAIEMPGSTHFHQPTPPTQGQLHPHQNRFSSAVSELSASSPDQGAFPQHSSQSDRQSYAESVSSAPSSMARGPNGMASPGLEKRQFMAELPANHGPMPERSPRSPDPNVMSAQQQSQHQQQYRYNPADYARMS